MRIDRDAERKSARVVSGLAPVRQSPAAEAETATFYHYGEGVRVFADEGGHALCRSEFDGYVGYVERRHIALGPARPETHYIVTLGSYGYAAPDLRSPAEEFLPRHSAVVVAETGLLTRGTEYAQLDSGLYLPLACLASEPPASPDMVAAAALYIGCPYLWGGRSFLGIDCSGLVQTAFRDIGVTVPRDTDMQQEAIGQQLPANDESELRRGDLLYLPGHVLIYEGAGTVIHADGATMTVRRDKLTKWLRGRSLDLAALVVRRL